MLSLYIIMDQQQQQPRERNETTNNLSQPNTELSLKFTESGGLSNRYLLISYNSKTKTITSSTDISGSNLKHKQLSESNERGLRDAISTNEFFNTKTDYPPEKEDESLIAYTLAITMGDTVHTTAWTNESKGIPECVKEIVSEIKRIISEEKII